MNKEPAALISALVAAISAALGLLVAFNIDITEAQQDAIITTVVAFSALIALVGPLIRQFVYSPNSVEKIAAEQYHAGKPPTDPQPDVPPPANV
jgi:hypothetical protein